MIEHWKKTGALSIIKEAYARGVLIAGLSAGAICWFEDMYSDSVVEGEYSMYKGLGWIHGKISPHYNERMLDFDKIVMYNRDCAWGVENGAALEIVDGEPYYNQSCFADVAKLADAQVSGSCGRPCRFKSCHPHHKHNVS